MIKRAVLASVAALALVPGVQGVANAHTTDRIISDTTVSTLVYGDTVISLDGHFRKNNRIRYFRMDFTDPIDRFNANQVVRQINFTGFRYITCEDRIITNAQMWSQYNHRFDYMSSYEGDHINQWMKQYAKNHRGCRSHIRNRTVVVDPSTDNNIPLS